MDEKELIILLTLDARKDPGKCSMAFSIAITALATDIKVKVFFADKGAKLATKGYADGIASEHFASISEMISHFIEGGGEFYICRPFMLACNIEEDDLIENVKIAAAPTLVANMADAHVLTF